MFKALTVDKVSDQFVPTVHEVDDSFLMDGDVLVEVEYSGINYKDAMAIFGTRPVLSVFPMIPGIDFVGRVLESSSPDFAVDSRVILNGWGVGEFHHGGFAERARVPSQWLIQLPDGISAKAAGIFGTAGYTAALSFLAIKDRVATDAGPIVVTGVGGGVGGLVTMLLSRNGYQVTAATSRLDRSEYMKSLGATDVITLDELNESGRQMQHEKWAGAVDVVGGESLASILAQTQYNGAVASCGLARDTNLPTTVLPFILRGVSLLGINSVFQPKELRERAWRVLEEHADIADSYEFHEIGLDGIVAASEKVLEGKAPGRFLVNPSL